MRLLLTLPCLMVAACSGQGTAITYTGTVRPEAGVCDAATQAELVIRNSAVLFAPASATLVLNGRQSGSVVEASKTLLGADRKSYVLKFRGEYQGRDITGIYQTPRCRYIVQLRRIQD